MLDVARIKADFPIFDAQMRGGKRLVFLDSGATSQKPRVVIEAEADFYFSKNAAVHRGSYLLAERASEAFDTARADVAQFLQVEADEIIFTKSATESLNILAYAFGNPKSAHFVKEGDEIVLSELEHHANLIPWQQLAQRTGAVLKWFNAQEDGSLDLSQISSIITDRTKIVAITHQSNVLGSIPDIKPIIDAAHAVGALFVLDACQSVPHMPVSPRELDIDFLAFSGHKALGPTGVGVLWGKAHLLANLEPMLFGGSMIESVTMTESRWADAPKRFEAGVPNMAQAVGLAAALKYLQNVGLAAIHSWELELTAKALVGLKSIEGVKVLGPQGVEQRGGVISFTIDQLHPHDVGQVLDQYGVAVRTGHHCAWPLIRKLGVTGTTRASFYLYNDMSDVDVLLESVEAARDYFRKN
jgi:cysteine desulfurase/selenocysteine lyase